MSFHLTDFFFVFLKNGEEIKRLQYIALIRKNGFIVLYVIEKIKINFLFVIILMKYELISLYRHDYINKFFFHLLVYLHINFLIFLILFY